MAGPNELPQSYRPSPTNCRPCPYCEKGFYRCDEQLTSEAYTYSSSLRDEEAGTIISGYLTTIKEATDAITKRMDTHGDLFMSRWKKLGQKNRGKLLRDIVPHIAPDSWHCFLYGSSNPDGSSKPASIIPKHVRNPTNRHQLLLPWLDLETLKNHPDVLFALLHHRIHNPPQAWAAFDIHQLDLGWKNGCFEVRFAPKYVIVYGLRYGKLTDWDFSASHRADILGFPRSELLFEAQAYLMATLRDIVLTVLDSVDEATLPRTSKWKELIYTCEFRHMNQLELWSAYAFPAFSPPPTLDMHRLTSLANARLRVNRDHLWELQCNPAYMRRQMKVFLGLNTGADAESMSSSSMLFTRHITDLVLNCVFWRWVEIECKKGEDLQRRFRDNIYPGQPVPPKFNTALGELESILFGMVIFTGAHMMDDIEASEVLRRNLTHQTICVQVKERYDPDDPLLWCLIHMTLPTTSQHNFTFDKALLSSHLQHILSTSSSQEKARVNEFIYRWIADLSAFSEMLSSVRLGRPQTEYGDRMKAEKTNSREEWRFMVDLTWIREQRLPCSLGRTLLGDFFKAEPPRGPKDLEWLRRSRVTRAGLERFWSSVYDFMTTTMRNIGISEDGTQELLQVITANQSTEYQQAILAEETKILADIEQQRHAIEGASQLAKSLEKVTTGKAIAEPKQEKIKTRPQGGQECSTSLSENETKSQNEAPDPDPRALHAIELMFPANGEEASKGLQWADFVHAMDDIGFVARHNGGSAVSFEAEGKDRIVFHRPHPDSKIAPVVLQSMGTRMNKWFGWTRESFALDEA
ncbi:hypothetical protein GGR51DRAFT_572264 [Nemania sp. FL0031]|nr:hypothetical protein GGR51DRAFT_572264 [Nemania sp. FL0031]